MKTKTDNLNKKESFILYNSFYELYFEELTTEEKGILIEAIFLYVKTGELYSEYIENDRYMRMAFKAIKDVLDRNNEKWNSTREARIKAANARWGKNGEVGDSRTIEMPDDSLLVMKGNLANMPTSYDEYKHRTGITNYEELRTFNNFCNQHEWCVSLEEMKQEYDAS